MSFKPAKAFRWRALGALCLLAGLATAAAAQPPAAPPAWAYPITPPGFVPPVDTGAPVRVPGSSASYSWSELRNLYIAPVWHPDQDPAMPAVVQRGRAPEVGACSHCHRVGGQGGPENANLAGLPHDYIVRQLRDYQRGTRSTALPARVPQALMIRAARALTDEEIEASARHFSQLQPYARIRVVESATIPRVEPGPWILIKSAAGGTEPLGQRLVELPEDLRQFEARDPRARFVAYVPPGSLRRGRALVQQGAPGVPACVLCHGPKLRGTPAGPPLAGRSPSYLVRQLYEFGTRVRKGEQAAVMQEVAGKLSLENMIAASAYLASLPP
jgi:cytochrome c553